MAIAAALEFALLLSRKRFKLLELAISFSSIRSELIAENLNDRNTLITTTNITKMMTVGIIILSLKLFLSVVTP